LWQVATIVAWRDLLQRSENGNAAEWNGKGKEQKEKKKIRKK